MSAQFWVMAAGLAGLAGFTGWSHFTIAHRLDRQRATFTPWFNNLDQRLDQLGAPKPTGQPK